MPIPLIWGITVAFSFLAWGVFAAQYIWPAISKRERAEAFRPILVLHGFRYIGLAVLIPGVVSPELPAAEGEAQAPICERLAVKFPGATRRDQRWSSLPQQLGRPTSI